MKNSGKYLIEMMKIDQEGYLCRQFSPQPLARDPWFWYHSICIDFDVWYNYVAQSSIFDILFVLRYLRHQGSCWECLISPLKRLSTKKILRYYTYINYIGLMKNGGKYKIEMTKIDLECYLFRRFSPQPLVKDSWFWPHSICLSKTNILMYNIIM